MKRDLCDECEDNDKGLSYCFDVCSVGYDILENIEKIRINNSTLNPDQAAGYYTAIKEIYDLVKDCKWPKDLEMEIINFLKERGMRIYDN